MQILPFDKRDGFIWLNGKFVKWSDANIHVLNHGLHYASCVFEGLRIYDGRIFKLNEHIERLFYSAKILDLDIPFAYQDVIDITKEIILKQNVSNGYVRPVVWRGSEMMAISAKKGSTNLAIAAWEWPSYFSPEKLLEGIKLNVSKWLRPSPESAPTDSKAAGLYMICSLSKHEAEKLGFDDALMLDYRGYIAEATGANIFFVKNSELFTPIADCFLNGITRQTVIEIAKENKIKVHESHFKLDFLKACDEVFLTGTAVEITPVSCIKKLNFEDRKLTKFLMSEFNKKVTT
ncbi:MAG: branched-chain amino acid aminotransferase [Rickettsiales bacterium]|nr:branched-chain amino acid aminotransferase [Rickettsiales bacterium]RPG15780.1 MAG: branched-chain amino acid aminotransferase [Pelagibacteraceae bacterium TMED195]|tara:strand:+ start:3562 stop:4434 length:873 start_codon:yes stop_codon:yes gene_type:complete